MFKLFPHVTVIRTGASLHFKIRISSKTSLKSEAAIPYASVWVRSGPEDNKY